MHSTTIMLAGGLDWLQLQIAAGLPDMAFFSQINDFLDDEIAEFSRNLLKRVAKLVGGVALTIVTWWIIYQGYRIVTGQSREPMMGLVANSLKAVLIVGVAVGAAAGAGSTYRALTDGLNVVIRKTVTGDEGEGSFADIDKALGIMQLALEVIDDVDSGNDLQTDDRKSRAMWFAGVGLGGPAIMAAVALLLNKIAMALVVGLGPIFVLCLLFDQTKPLFSRWLHHCLGTLFSMAVLTVMVTLALDMVIAVGAAFWATGWMAGGQESLTSMAMQQGGLGLVLSMLILSAPPMAAMFFQGVMGQFSGYNALAGQASPSANVPPAQATHPRPSHAPVMQPPHILYDSRPVYSDGARVPDTIKAGA